MSRIHAALALAGMLSAAGAADSHEPPAAMRSAHAAMAGMAMGPSPAIYAGQPDKPGAPLFKGLGRHRHPISTRNPKAQAYFDQGVALLFGFNHAEAIRSFREAARLDPKCAMCWWGVAFALGPNINLPMQADAMGPAWTALAKAQGLAPTTTVRERAWIKALAARYAKVPPADRHALDEAFAAAMGRLWRAYPSDLDAGVFYAEAMMDTQPWDLWASDGVTPKGHAAEIVKVLEGVIKRDPSHPGALHLYIHAVEGSTTPERAEAAADRLATLMPGAGHIVHMPAHIYYRVGRYADAARVNELAARADEDYIAACRAQGYYPAAYYGHNIHFLWTASEMEGRYGAALDAARRLIKAVDPIPLAARTPQAELFVFTPVVTQLRFGKWDEVLAEPMPPAALILDQAVFLYARGVALANKGRLEAAGQVRDALASLVASADFSRYERSGMPAEAMAKLGLELLDGEIARAGGDPSAAVAHFRAAADIEAKLPYTEPPWWHQPVSHVLGAALLEAKQPAEAEGVYRESLKVYRDDGWALFGLAQALEAQGKTEEAAKVRARFEKAWGQADVKLASS
ncbi:MAG: tetratricopeptide repeat protein, partial [Caulobacteraceae bacterium]|nr:tetratricopeptide repeat protein [Caulobacteraceae bacterium]